MKFRRFLLILAISYAVAWTSLKADDPVISLAEAQQIAVRNHPRIASAELAAQASGFAQKQVRSAYYPTVTGNVTGVGTEHDSVLSAGTLTTSSIYSRQASGFVASQLLSDFGRTSALLESAKLRAQSQDQNAANIRAQVLLGVDEAYFQALAARSVLRVAQATLDLRRVTLRQVTALARSSLRSTVDVSFAQVTESQAELGFFQAQNNAAGSHARLAAAMGYGHDQPFALQDEPLPATLSPNVDGLIEEAMRARPDLVTLRLQRDALDRFAVAEKRLRNPSVSAAAAAGVAPVRDPRLPETYSAAGINVSIPVLNGGLFKARQEEAESHAAAAAKDVETLSVEISRDVRVAWLNANNAFQRIAVTERMVSEANEALRLAQARYDNALGSIVELNQAQLNQTSAQMEAASAKYEYLDARAALNYAIGTLR